MKTELALIALLTLAGTALFFQQGNSFSQNLQGASQTTKDFEIYTQWKYQMNKNNTNSIEDSLRFAIFQENLRFIEQFNANNTRTVLGLTEFADMTNEEFRAAKTSKVLEVQERNTLDFSRRSLKNAPASFNWADKGVVSPIKNQGNCGSCWAFSAVNSLEGLNAINSGSLQQFSEQQLTSCIPFPFSLGCNGGNPLYAFLYTSDQGIESEEAYPYVQENNPKTAACEYDSSKVVFQNVGAGAVPANSPSDMQSQLLKQPLSVGIAASSLVFQLYSSGVIDSEHCGTDMDHNVGLIGYNFEGENNYWIIKNSWGTSWGNKGFGYVQNSNGAGICGINQDVSFPQQVYK